MSLLKLLISVFLSICLWVAQLISIRTIKPQWLVTEQLAYLACFRQPPKRTGICKYTSGSPAVCRCGINRSTVQGCSTRVRQSVVWEGHNIEKRWVDWTTNWQPNAHTHGRLQCHLRAWSTHCNHMQKMKYKNSRPQLLLNFGFASPHFFCRQPKKAKDCCLKWECAKLVPDQKIDTHCEMERIKSFEGFHNSLGLKYQSHQKPNFLERLFFILTCDRINRSQIWHQTILLVYMLDCVVR